MMNGTRVLITGASGLLGRYLLKTAPRDWSATPTYFSNDVFKGNAYRLDITDENAVKYIVERVRPNYIINCAALGSVDYCERNPSHARSVNSCGTVNVLNAAADGKVTVVHVSSNAVFGGDNPPYAESDPRNPVNFYGIVKRDAEDYVMNYEHNWLIIRPIMLYGWPFPRGRGNWVTRFEEFMGAGLELRIVDDVVTQPTYAHDCAEAIWTLLRAGFDRQVFHIGGYDHVSLYEFAVLFAELFGADTSLVVPVKSSEFPSMARRPVDTTYDLTRMIEAGIRPAELRTGLQRMLWENVNGL